ncbi:MAG TPA: MFS transporter, partial [Rhodanobacteraceae bacterium]
MNTPAEPAPGRATATAVFIGLLAALAGLMFGLDIGVISGATQFIQRDFRIGDHTIELIVSSMMLGAAIGAFVAGFLSASLGRKRSLIIAAVLFVIGSLLSAFASSPETLIGARIVLGFAIGIATFTAPLYLAEISSERSRGAMVSTYQLMITIGILIAFLSDTAFSYSG